MAQEEVEWFKKELQHVEQEISKKELIPLIKEERDRLVEDKKILLSALQVRMASPSGEVLAAARC